MAADLERAQRRLRAVDAESAAAAAARDANAQLLQQQEAAADALQVSFTGHSPHCKPLQLSIQSRRSVH